MTYVETDMDDAHAYILKMEKKLALMEEALGECEEYFDNIADCDCDQDGYIPNKEMQLLCAVRDALNGGRF